jgi:putative endopeptidase
MHIHLDQSVTLFANYLRTTFFSSTFCPSPKDRQLNGQEQQKPRWKRVLGVLQSEVSDGNALGRLYCEKHFPAASKELMLEYIDEILGALGDRLQAITWMSDATKENAQRKLSAFKVKVGFPDKWKDMSALELSADEGYWTNIARSRVHSDQLRIANLNLPPDLVDWSMPPQMVNAYFHPVKNEIVFPAAILQPPFFSKDYDPALGR